MKRGPKHVRCPSGELSGGRLDGAHSAAGFSLIELLAVAAILLLLCALYWGPALGGNRQRQAQKDCQTHLQKIYVALAIYANDHAGRFPELAGARMSEEALDGLVPRYTVDRAVFTCPGSGDRLLPAGESLRGHRISYAYCMGRQAADSQQVVMSDEQVNTRAKAAGEYAFSSTGRPPGNNHGKLGGNFLFCDGHTDATPPCVPFPLALTNGVVWLNPKPR
jgi:prepilin-type N-terminal cleavage/methylation domain-containing protein/prepilin-type processing-associated H-X9-DG protein